jgi:hypothetical protein
MTWKKNKKKWENKIMGHWGHTEILFFGTPDNIKKISTG